MALFKKNIVKTTFSVYLLWLIISFQLIDHVSFSLEADGSFVDKIAFSFSLIGVWGFLNGCIKFYRWFNGIEVKK